MLRLTWINALLLTFATISMIELLGYYFTWAMWRYPNAWQILAEETLPGMIYTVILSPVLFWLVKSLYIRLHRNDE